MDRKYQMYINGQWVNAVNGKAFDDFNPFTGEVFARVAAATRKDAEHAIDAAAEAFPAWAAISPSQKQMYLLRAAEIVEKRKQEFAQILAEEAGACISFAMFQISLCSEIMRYAASQVHNVMGKILPPELPGEFSIVLCQPVGVVAGITPWNGPFVLSANTICAPIAYGNTVVLKPSAESPVSGGIIFAQIFEEAGFPKGILNVVTNGPGRSGEIGDEFVTNRLVKRIAFTGSTEVGKELAEKAGRHLKKTVLELGGNDPLIILNDADIDYAVNAATFGRFLHQGQICMNSKRIIIEKTIAHEFIDKFVKKASALKIGDPINADTVIGPLINTRQLKLLSSQVEKAIQEGAKLLCGGKYRDLCYYPTVLSDITEDMEIFHQETFGPVASVIVVEDSDEAVRVANNSTYGLSSGVITRDFKKGLEIAERLEAGVTHVNDSSVGHEVHAPMGGLKESGWGKSGMGAMEEYTETRWVSFQRTERTFPF